MIVVAVAVVCGCVMGILLQYRLMARLEATSQARLQRITASIRRTNVQLATIRRLLEQLDGAAPHQEVEAPGYDASLAEAVAAADGGAVKAGPGQACWTGERGRC